MLDKKIVFGIGAVGVAALVLLQKGGGGGTTVLSNAPSPQAASIIASENEAANQTAASTQLGLASIAASYATTVANDRAGIVQAAQQGANSLDLARIQASTAIGLNQQNTQASEYGSNLQYDLQLQNLSDSQTVALDQDADQLQLGLKGLGVAKDISNNQATIAERQGKAAIGSSLISGLLGGFSSFLTGGGSGLLGGVFGGGSGSSQYSGPSLANSSFGSYAAAAPGTWA